MSSKTIVRREECNVKLIDALVKNKWRWTWMEEEHTDGVVFGVYMRKITKPGYALCLWCELPVNRNTNIAFYWRSHCFQYFKKNLKIYFLNV